MFHGQIESNKCVACHGFEAGGANKVGPNLYNIVNKVQAKADFSYSKALSSLSGKWSYEELNKFLYKPWELEKKYQEQIKVVIGTNYPEPMVDHATARNAALEAFQKIKKN